MSIMGGYRQVGGCDATPLDTLLLYPERQCFKSGDGNSYRLDLQGVISIYIHV
jgi:hypothetical protein